MDLGRAIKTVRVQRGLSQSELANIAGISVSYLSLLERDKRDPAFTTIENITKALDVPMILLIFIASDESERMRLGDGTCEKLALLALRIGVA